ncbi:hypothetical protein GCM10009557_02750 [Virgisporangium ochraceum]|uniref:Uncharacterized protein n=1 Tax=Virgisporangium ochraceum TaxID=65505 RepID=A0A8J4A3R0_9ACTN|nr:hypothetical protein Voc01_077170 [Virgisporangium ochraceum]
MVDLHDLLAKTAEGEPPTRLSAESLFLAGRRERRYKIMVGAGGVIAAVAATVVGMTAVLGSGPAVDPVGTKQPDPRYPRANWLVMSADQQYQYASLPSPCGDKVNSDRTCQFPIVGSDDGGKTWTRRSTDRRLLGATVLDGQMLFADEIPFPYVAGPNVDPVVSQDGGRTWQKVTISTNTVEAVPDGGTVWSDYYHKDAPVDAVVALDPVTATLSPLAHQPDLQSRSQMQLSRTTGTTWVAGTKDGQPAVATSHDRGRTWKNATIPASGCAVFRLSVVGEAATVTCTQDHQGSIRVFRSTDDGATFPEIKPPQPFPTDANTVWAFPNGTVVAAPAGPGIQVIGASPSPAEPMPALYVLRPGAKAWDTITPRGLAGQIGGMTLLPNGEYLAMMNGNPTARLQRSTDLTNWIDVAIPI